MFIGENLTNLRIMNGFSRKQLSDMLGVTEQAIWQYEHNYTAPKMNLINDLTSIFHVKSKYFYKLDALSRFTESGNIPTSNIAYRSQIIHSTSKTNSETKHMEFLDSLVNYLSTKVTYPTQMIIQLRDQVIDYLNATSDKRDVQIRKTADLARQELGLCLNTNSDLMFLIEKSGVFIFEKALGEDIGSYSTWTKRDCPFIMLGHLKRSAARRNFDMAHELGHLLLHYQVEFTNLNRKEHKAIENEANQFASAFLLPEKTFREDMKDIFHLTNPDAYLDLKKKWQTSMQVLGYRAADLGILEAKKHRNFYAALHRKGYLKQEPLDSELSVQLPQKIKSIINVLAVKGIIDIQQMIEIDWMVEIDFFYRLTGIEPNFFRQYMIKTQDFEFIQPK
ncbi:spr1629 family repressor/antitoxin [Gracilibacillus alcaliphilus]|uniref:spr1629 family repressor/antitoxin n=1 Tax=Gracilibacillus alcaliphilus TaxID=1401441 RepID=UPI00195A39CF|nr:XRE family transcriptional regulator [Gracilibacillus alcaliphilus]MBM7677533.1 Zn-dependent peptidase ImmA (M78 family)/transcriptional regulator with XRE-family HTH domain [Gracilibacillus alcaliphilus]